MSEMLEITANDPKSPKNIFLTNLISLIIQVTPGGCVIEYW